MCNPTKKTCNRCKKSLPLTSFTKRPDRPIGFYGICKKCKSESRSKRYRERKQTSPRELWVDGARSNAKDRSRRAGVGFCLTKDDVLNAIHRSGGNCEYCNRKLDFRLTRSDPRWSAPSLDRVIPNIGYTPDNTVVCCYRCNAVKNNASPEELLALAVAVERIVKDRELA